MEVTFKFRDTEDGVNYSIEHSGYDENTPSDALYYAVLFKAIVEGKMDGVFSIFEENMDKIVDEMADQAIEEAVEKELEEDNNEK